MRDIPSRVTWMMAFLILGLLAMAGRLYRLSVAETALWQGQAQENMVRELPNYGPRGFIYDARGRPLAVSEPAYAVMLTDQDPAHVEKALPALAEVLSGGDPAKARSIADGIRQQVARNKAAGLQFEPLLVETNLSPAEVTALTERRPELPGVVIKLQSTRRYPQGSVAGAVMGYVGAIGEELKEPAFAGYNADEVVGKDGIELAYEPDLRAKPGSDSVIVDPLGKRVGGATETPPIPGNNIYLTLDLDLQRVAETALTRQMEWIRQLNDPHAKPVRGALVVQNVKTGAILAMVSIPTYDPNWLIGGITEDRWQQLQKQPGAMVNWAIKGFAPGSTYKMATALAGLEAGVLGPNEQIRCPATYWKYGNPKNWNGDQGVTDVARALAISCNPFFFEVGDRLGMDRLAASNEHLGFGRQTGFDLPGESPGANPSQATYGDDFLPGYTINAA
ncbi:MAG: penicillin-binding transpeptidase domain-containing protein, partial [Mycobacterium leprae]